MDRPRTRPPRASRRPRRMQRATRGRPWGRPGYGHVPKSSPMARSTRTVDPASSSGSRRRRCRSADGAIRRRYASSTTSAPSRLASARAARINVSSPRSPAVPSAMQSCAARSSAASGTSTESRRCARFEYPLADLVVLALPLLDISCGIALELVTPSHDQDPRRQVFRRADFDRQSEAVEQLRTQVALFRVAAAHEHEARRVPDAEAFALDHVLTGGRHVEQQVDQVVFEQVHFVDVEKAAMGPCQQAGFEGLFALRQRTLQVEGADDAVFSGAERHVDHGNGSQAGPGQRGCSAGTAFLAELGRLGIATIAAARHDPHLRQQCRKRTHRGGLAGAAVAEHQHPADTGVHGCDEQRELHLVLADDCTERKRYRHAESFLGLAGRWAVCLRLRNLHRRRTSAGPASANQSTPAYSSGHRRTQRNCPKIPRPWQPPPSSP